MRNCSKCVHCAAFWTLFLLSCRINMHKIIIHPLGFLLLVLSPLPHLPPSGCHQGPTGANYIWLWVTEAPPTWGWLQARSAPAHSQPSKHSQDWGSRGVLSSIAIWAVKGWSQKQMARKHVPSSAISFSPRAMPISTLLSELPFSNPDLVIWVPVYEYCVPSISLQGKVKLHEVISSHLHFPWCSLSTT